MVGSARTSNGIKHAVKWTPAGQIVDLHPPAADESFADDVTNAGIVVGRIIFWYEGQPYSLSARWDSTGKMTLFGPLHPKFGDLDIAISSNGWVAGNYTPGIAEMAFTYSPSSQYVLASGTHNSLLDVNWSGRAVGSHDGAASIFMNGNWAELPSLGGSSSLATAVNNCGTIVGAARNAAGRWRPVRWSRRECDTARGS